MNFKTDYIITDYFNKSDLTELTSNILTVYNLLLNQYVLFPAPVAPVLGEFPKNSDLVTYEQNVQYLADNTFRPAGWQTMGHSDYRFWTFTEINTINNNLNLLYVGVLKQMAHARYSGQFYSGN